MSALSVTYRHHLTVFARTAQVLVAELLKDSASAQRRQLLEHVLSTTPALCSSTWEQELRTASAQMAGVEGSAISEVSGGDGDD